MQNFTGQKVIISGASRGIGKGISLAFLRQGATVIGVYGGNREAADKLQEECTEFGDRLQLHQCDVSKASQVDVFFNKLKNNLTLLTS